MNRGYFIGLHGVLSGFAVLLPRRAAAQTEVDGANNLVATDTDTAAFGSVMLVAMMCGLE
jgi:hypothetical protein